MNQKAIILSLSCIVLPMTGCISPFPIRPTPLPDAMYQSPGDWHLVVKNYSGTATSESRKSNSNREWQWGGWTAYDNNGDGVVDWMTIKIKDKDWFWASVHEVYEDSEFHGIFNRHYYKMEDGLIHRESKIAVRAPRVCAAVKKGEQIAAADRH